MIVVQFVLAQLADNAPSDMRELALLANHKSVGITILVLAMLRIVWRLRHTPPALPAAMPRWQATASNISHWSLYALLFAVPLTGWLMSSASAYSVSWFNLFQLPDFVAPNAMLKDVFEETHEVLAKLLLVIASVHVGAAVKHAAIDKDAVLRRMTSFVSVAVFAIVAVSGIAWLGGAGSTKPTTSDPTPVATSVNSTVAHKPESASYLPLWEIDYAASHIRFVGDQAGAEFDGTWERWTAQLQFSTSDIDAGIFYVAIDTSSANTQDEDRDVAMADPEWFDSANYPEATFRASRFSDIGEGKYVANGQLSIKGVTSPVQLHFTVESNGDRHVLEGEAQLDRLELGIGTGEWEDTEWVGKDVTVLVRVEATSSD
jgi:cytochrome b561/polyisoprenoid-binding protein YceI